MKDCSHAHLVFPANVLERRARGLASRRPWSCLTPQCLTHTPPSPPCLATRGCCRPGGFCRCRQCNLPALHAAHRIQIFGSDIPGRGDSGRPTMSDVLGLERSARAAVGRRRGPASCRTAVRLMLLTVGLCFPVIERQLGVNGGAETCSSWELRVACSCQFTRPPARASHIGGRGTLAYDVRRTTICLPRPRLSGPERLGSLCVWQSDQAQKPHVRFRYRSRAVSLSPCPGMVR
ncbi:uncharacterized protein LY79DRAFT_42227 [Colletotrichum navitas]|uniref:Uncharacterized protein n=1 Tax=Colletotrichum navitas TaxID=681940 RepID=A0AAD8PMI7_9PEZI|nr:uncharacterized protein LY79DRAFT_42227 [Colletotrichum navitas]KAK1572830.1 hypothetical protein LY79DRAFT_42227 [Colletotrichum navitas]